MQEHSMHSVIAQHGQHVGLKRDAEATITTNDTPAATSNDRVLTKRFLDV